MKSKDKMDKEKKKQLVNLAVKVAVLCEKTRMRLFILPLKIQQAYFVIRENQGIQASGLEEKMGVSQSTAKRYVCELAHARLIKRIGSRKTGGYYITETDADRLLQMSHCRKCYIYKHNIKVE